jgi:hypothetical protein
MSWRVSLVAPRLVRCEHQRAAGCRGQVHQDRKPGRRLDVQDVVGHLGDRRGRRVDAVRDRVVQELPHQHVHPGVERGGEEQPLTGARGLLEQPGDVREEAEVGHVVGLVEHGDLHRVEPGVPGLDVIDQPARAGDEDVDPGPQTGDLRVRPHAAVDGQGPQGQGLGERRHRRVDLAGQLAGGRQDQRTRTAAPPRHVAGGEPGEDGQRERVGLARSGSAAAEHVAAGQRVRQRRRLDGERRDDALGGQRRLQLGGHAELGERPAVGRRRVGGGRAG